MIVIYYAPTICNASFLGLGMAGHRLFSLKSSGSRSALCEHMSDQIAVKSPSSRNLFSPIAAVIIIPVIMRANKKTLTCMALHGQRLCKNTIFKPCALASSSVIVNDWCTISKTSIEMYFGTSTETFLEFVCVMIRCLNLDWHIYHFKKCFTGNCFKFSPPVVKKVYA